MEAWPILALLLVLLMCMAGNFYCHKCLFGPYFHLHDATQLDIFE
uniref:Uncharacterized protein n=1 Tax=Rhizophora mucronata TaxID=61149 RepID=A0A2P2QHP5_RHIMU